MTYAYLITPFFSWLVTGVLKFLINSVKNRRLAFDLIGYGGMPSNHSTIVSSMTMLVFLKEGISSPAFGVALALSFIVLLDANSLRKQIEKHAISLNALGDFKLRERIGHSKAEIGAGCLVGCATATALHAAGI
ncbi:divergent PAP2 family protein [Alcaligenes parafaecalis]|uniref:Divergent PAP2 family protein n=1 Tax=Alcaligenes parafaecalis TaxID=171260 RepID=A0ABT3VM57_9BURK|nr:divergent PAP2 family protein [Alcaligenes parafaecalis]MCX5464217.1 divergent PAP2 family protein [Alcaligenes parafaecalis]